jgi:hypothetical protein
LNPALPYRLDPAGDPLVQTDALGPRAWPPAVQLGLDPKRDLPLKGGSGFSPRSAQKAR